MKMKPVIPFEPITSNEIPQGDQWISQVKWDGVHVLTYSDGDVVKLFNRKQNERTMQFPEFTNIERYCTGDSVILDGEIIAFHNGKPSFHDVMRRDGIRKKENVEHARRKTNLTYMIFDVLYYNGEWVTEKSLEDRQQLLLEIIISQEDVQLVNNFRDGEGLFRAIKEQGMEGIISKRLDSSYVINGKNDRWRKIKNYRDLVAVIGGVTFRNGIVNAILLGLYDEEDKFWYIGHAGTGRLSKVEWRELTERIQLLVIKERPFVNQPDRTKDAIWIKPLITVKIQYAEWAEGRSLRQPSIQAFTEVSPNECIIQQEMFM